MDAEFFRHYCLSKPRVTESTPFGESTLVFKIDGKVFALLSLDAMPSEANLKCDPDRALDLRDRHEQVLPGYHMNKKHWNTVILDEDIADKLVREMIDHSYDLVVAKTRKSS